MSLSIQFFSLLVMIGTGIIAGAVIDHLQMLNIAHQTKRSTRFLYSSIEVMGWIVTGCWAFYMLYIVREGAWRIYDPLAQLSGLFLYVTIFYKPIRLLGRLIHFMFIKPIFICIRIGWAVIKLLFTIVFYPFFFIYKTIHRIFSRMRENPF